MLKSKSRGTHIGLSLDDLRDELRENYLRTEEVLSGMDAYIAKLDKRISSLEGRGNGGDSVAKDSQPLERRLAALEGQIAEIAAALYADDDADRVAPATRIIVG